MTQANQLSMSDAPHGAPSWLARWVAAARPKTLPLTVSPVVAGIALAVAEAGQLAVWPALLTLIGAVAIQIGTNLYNDAADFERGTDTADRVGPPRATAQGWLTAGQVKTAAHLMFAMAFVIGLLLLARGGLPILIVGLASLAAGYSYTGGPRPIAYGPYGELFVVLFFGLAAVGGTYYLQTLSFGWTPLLAGAALGLPAAAVLLINNYRDLDTDRAAGRRTLCHHLGRARARRLYPALLLAPLPMLMLGPVPGAAWPLLAALPIAIALTLRLYRGAAGAELNRQLAQTALYQALLVALMVLSLLLP